MLPRNRLMRIRGHVVDGSRGEPELIYLSFKELRPTPCVVDEHVPHWE